MHLDYYDIQNTLIEKLVTALIVSLYYTVFYLMCFTHDNFVMYWLVKLIDYGSLYQSKTNYNCLILVSW